MNRPVPEHAQTGNDAEQVELQIPELAGRARARRILMLSLVLAAAAGAVYYYTRPEPVTELYRTEKATLRTLVQQVEAAGKLEVRSRTEVPAPVPGRLIGIHVSSGQTVKVGDLLAELDVRAAVLVVRGAQASAQAAAGQMAQARASFEAAERGVERARTLMARGLASAEDLANSQSELARAKAATEAARGQQKVAGENVASAKLSQTLGRIEAPAAGVVLLAPESLGAAVSPAAGPLFVIGEPLTTMRVDAIVSETEVAQVKLGQPAEVLVAALPGRSFRAQVKRVGIEPDRSHVAVMYPVQLLVENPDGLLLPGMTARVRMEVARVANVLAVHEATLRFQPEGADPADPRSRVWRRMGPKELEGLAVQVGISDGIYAEIKPRGDVKIGEGDAFAVGLANPDAANQPRLKLGDKK